MQRVSRCQPPLLLAFPRFTCTVIAGIIERVTDSTPTSPRQQDQKLARAKGGNSMQRLDDPSTHVGLEPAMIESVAATVEASPLLPSMKAYLVAFARHGYKGKACAAAGVTAQMPHWWRKHEEHGEAFRELEQIVQDALVERLEESVDVRGFLGYLEPVFGSLGRPEIEERETQDGKGTVVKEVVQRFTGVVGYVRKFDNQLAMFRLKALAPEKYAERRKTELSGPGGGPVQVAPVVDRLSTQLERMLGASNAETIDAEPAE